MQDTDYIDLKNGEREKMFFYMLNAYLCSRLDTECESDQDEEVNVYMAHLLHSLVDGSFYTENAGVLANTPLDVFSKVEDGGNRHKIKVYRTNADHRLVAFGLFSGLAGHQGLYRKAMTHPEAYLEQAQQYYGWAASFSQRLPGKYAGLTSALHKLARDFETYHSVLNHMGANYMGLMARLSPGEVFHIERQAHEGALPAMRQQALDQMLDAYGRWRREPSAEHRKVFSAACARYQEMDPNFADGSWRGEEVH